MPEATPGYSSAFCCGAALTALPTLGLLDGVHDYASGGLGRNALSAAALPTPRDETWCMIRAGARD